MEWRTIPRFSRYEITSLGYVRLKGKNTTRKWVMRHGYPSCGVEDEHGRSRVLYIHRHVAEAFLGPCPSPLHEVCHADGNRGNPSLNDLAWKTKSANAMDRHRHGTMSLPRGEQHYKAKLTLQAVSKIKELDGTMFRKDIALLFGVSKGTITNVMNGRVWADVAKK